MYKICQCIFSTNRPEYLTRTLAAQRHLDFSGCEVDKILFDDMPKDRDDEGIRAIARAYGYNEVYLHDRNLSIGATWEEFWGLIRDRGYDYIFHSEDDVEVLEPVSVLDMIDVVSTYSKVSQVVLKRQAVYPHEKPPTAADTDTVFREFRGEFSDAQVYFTPICSLYSAEWAGLDYRGWYKLNYPNDSIFHTANINEALIGKVLLEGHQLFSMHLKNSTGGNIISHIGEYSWGQKVLPHEPGFAPWKDMDSEVKYRTGTRHVYTQ